LSGQPRTKLAVEAVNGRTGLVLRRDGLTAVVVVSFSIDIAEVVQLWIVHNPDKLHGWHRR
jgi:RNA polymerase sigma-70 factor (ECF subfamily)